MKINFKEILLRYITTSLSVFTCLLLDDIHGIYMKINMDIPYELVITLHFLISFCVGVVILILYVIFFNLILKIRLKNITLYFLILFLVALSFFSREVYQLIIGDVPKWIFNFLDYGILPLGLLIFGGIIKLLQKK